MVVTAILSTLLLGDRAGAHAVLSGSDPADGSSVGQSPAAVHLRFSENVSPRFRSAQLIGSDGRALPGAHLVEQPDQSRTLTLALPPLDPAAYGVLWQVLADNDGHTSSGLIVFSVGVAAPASGLVSSTSSAGGPSPLDVARRWLGLGLLAVVVGGLAMAGLVLAAAEGPAHERRPYAGQEAELAADLRCARRRVLGLVVAGTSAAALLGLADLAAELSRLAAQQTASESGRSAAVHLLAGTRWGHLWLLREAALLTLAPLVLRLRPGPGRGPTSASLGPLAAALVLAVVCIDALASHVATGPSYRSFAVAVLALHLLAACCWLGALPAVALTLWRSTGQRRLAVVRACRAAFGRLAGLSALTAVLTGLVVAGRQVDEVSALSSTGYGRTLLAKLILVGALVGLGLVNATRMRGRNPPSRPSVLLEAGAGLLVLLAAGALVETVPARDQAVRYRSPGDARIASGSQADLLVSVSASPNLPGVNGFTVRADSTRRPPPDPIAAVRLELDQAGGITTVALHEVSAGRYVGTGLLESADALKLAPSRLSVVIDRAGRELAVPLAWSRDSTTRSAPASGRRLAPFTDGLALVTLAAAVVAGAAMTRRSRRTARPFTHPHSPGHRAQVSSDDDPPSDSRSGSWSRPNEGVR